ncbi:Peroxidase 16 [Linum perenne]
MAAPSHHHLLLLTVLLILPILPSEAQLSTDFYKNTCPNVESIVRSAVRAKFQQTFVTAPATLRLFFHDCFVRVSGDGFDTVIKAKAAVDRVPNCRNKVSCADILALATREVVSMTGGPFYRVELGRRDGRISTKASVQHKLPNANFNLDQLNTIFAARSLSQTDMIALSGAHTLGFSHCNQFSKRIYNFSPRNRVDPTLNFQYAMQLRQMCPTRVDPRIAINMDPTTPQQFDNAYFRNLQQGKGLFSSDQVLFTDPRSRSTVNMFASSNAAFQKAFVDAMTKLGRVGVITGAMGEIRRDCSRVN